MREIDSGFLEIVRKNKNNILSWTLCMLSATSGGASIANSLINTHSLEHTRAVWVIGENPTDMGKELEKINKGYDREIEKSIMISTAACGISYCLYRIAQEIDKKVK